MAKAKKKSARKMSLQSKILLAVFAMTAVVFNKVSIILMVGMLPTIIVRLVDRSPERTKVLTVGFMNFAGCFPFCLDLVQKGRDPVTLLSIISNPVNIIIMFGAAGLGYLIEWGVVGFVASLMVQKGKHRIAEIKKTQENLIKKWGPEVTGEMPLDANGFSTEISAEK